MKRSTISCEFCGNAIRGNSFTIKVEGALLTVCSNCTQFGKIVESPKSKAVSTASPVKTTRRPVQSVRNPPKKYRPRQADAEKALSEDYSSKIQSARTKNKMTREVLAAKTGISTSQIASFESGKLRPTDNEAKKLERVLGISLFEETMADPEFLAKESTKKVTFGDIVEIKRRDK